jgi:hypothetical protein
VRVPCTGLTGGLNSWSDTDDPWTPACLVSHSVIHPRFPPRKIHQVPCVSRHNLVDHPSAHPHRAEETHHSSRSSAEEHGHALHKAETLFVVCACCCILLHISLLFLALPFSTKNTNNINHSKKRYTKPCIINHRLRVLETRRRLISPHVSSVLGGYRSDTRCQQRRLFQLG